MSDHTCFDCGHLVSHHSGQAAATGCRDCDCPRWFNVLPAPGRSGDRPSSRIPRDWDRTHWREIRDGVAHRERWNQRLFAVLWLVLRAIGAVDRRLRWAEVRDQDWNRPRPRWRVWLTPKVAAVHEALQHFAARRVF
jgi:predicted  nucleic acid-binding Zn-ribbon protein